MESVVSILGTITMMLISLSAARRWAKSEAQALVWGVAAGAIAAVVVFSSVVFVYHFDPEAFYAPALGPRLFSAAFLGPIGGALMTISAWRRTHKTQSSC